jgi:hypothetical protein
VEGRAAPCWCASKPPNLAQSYTLETLRILLSLDIPTCPRCPCNLITDCPTVRLILLTHSGGEEQSRGGAVSSSPPHATGAGVRLCVIPVCAFPKFSLCVVRSEV